MGNKSIEVGPLEMKTLGLLENSGALSVADIQALLKKTGDDLAYTTVMTVLVRLFNKGFLVREKEGRQFLYSVKAKANFSQKIFERFKDRLFHGERLKPILALIDADEDLTREELLELKRQVDAKLKQKKS